MPAAQRAETLAQNAVIALDLGGTKLAACLFAESGKPIARRATRLGGRQGADVAALIGREIRRLLEAGQQRGLTVRAVGICVPGIAHARSGRVWAPNIGGWDDFPLRKRIRAELDEPSIPVAVESDRAACILGETWRGAGRGCRDAIFLAVGTGIGAGILSDGRLVRGAHDSAGAIGWLALDRPFARQYAHCGCFESHASGEGIARVARALLARRRNYQGPLRGQETITARRVFSAYEQSDPLATEVIHGAVAFWGMACANLVSLFNPQMIVFGGGVFGPARRLLGAIEGEARRWAQPVAMSQVELQASQLAGNAALYGAAYVALRRARLPLS